WRTYSGSKRVSRGGRRALSLSFQPSPSHLRWYSFLSMLSASLCLTTTSRFLKWHAFMASRTRWALRFADYLRSIWRWYANPPIVSPCTRSLQLDQKRLKGYSGNQTRTASQVLASSARQPFRQRQES